MPNVDGKLVSTADRVSVENYGVRADLFLDLSVEPDGGEPTSMHGVVDDLREHFATKAALEAMGRRLVMWVGGLLAVFVPVMGWLVQRA